VTKYIYHFNLIALALHLGATSLFGAYSIYCDGKFLILGSEGISLGKNEVALLCGDRNIEAWTDVTTSQALFVLKSFLEDRGYFGAVSEEVAVENRKVVRVTLGEKVYVKNWQLKGAPPEIKPKRYRKIYGEPIKPTLLDNVSDRLTRDLGAEGYACPEVKNEAVLADATLWSNFNPGKQLNVIKVDSDVVPPLDSRIFRRYDAFVIGKRFNRNLLALTESRIGGEKIVQSSHFNVECLPEGVALRQRNMGGAARLFVVGFGVNTETWLSAKTSWKHTRLGSLGSSVELSLKSTFKTQEFQAISDWYFSPDFNRFHLKPGFSLKRENEDPYERYVGQVNFTPATSYDNSELGMTATFGPSLAFTKTVRGAGPKDTEFIAFHSNIRLMSHLFELFSTDPREGYQLELNSLAAFRGVLSSVDAQRFEVKGTHLWNFLNLDPPFLILGVRAGVSTTFTPERVGTTTALPSNFRQFLGGSSDLRGFNRLALPGPNGALTSLNTSVEARLPDLLPWGFQPLAFIDAGQLGVEPMKLDSPTYWNPGAGLRWASPIGAFRATLAKGSVWGDAASPLNGWRLYLSYGEEF